MAECSVASCTKDVVARGFCDMHYRRHKKHGDPLRVCTTEERRAISARTAQWMQKETPQARKARRAKGAAAIRARREPRFCAVCSTPFGGPEDVYVKPAQMTCSQKCGHAFRKTQAQKRRDAGFGGGFAGEKTCPQCETVFFVDRASQMERRRFCSNTCRAAFQSAQPYEEWRAKIGAQNTGRLAGRKNPMWGRAPGHGKRVEYTRANGETLTFRSTWEAEVAAYLDARQEPWEYEPRRFVFDHLTYVPDFYLPLRRAYWEVKGWMSDKAKRRIDAFRQHRTEPLVVIGKHAMDGIRRQMGASA